MSVDEHKQSVRYTFSLDNLLKMRVEEIISKKVFLGLLLLIIVISVFSFQKYRDNNDLPSIDSPITRFTEVSVDGEIITTNEVNKVLQANENLPEQLKQELSREEVVEQLVNQKLLLQEADKKGIKSTNDEVNDYIQRFREYNNLDENSFEKSIVDQGITIEELRNDVTNQITIIKLLNEELELGNVEASEKDIDIYLENDEGFQFILDEVEPDMEEQFRNRVRLQITKEMQQEIYDDYIEKLKKNSKIKY